MRPVARCRRQHTARPVASLPHEIANDDLANYFIRPADDFNGTVIITVQVQDTTDLWSAEGTFSLEVTQVVDPIRTRPVTGVDDGKLINDIAGRDVGAALLEQEIDLSLHFEEVDPGESITGYEVSGVTRDGVAVDLPAWESLLSGTRLVTGFDVPAVAAGIYVLTITATSSDGTSATKTLTVTVTNADPVASAAAVTPQTHAPGAAITPVDFSTHFTDANGDPLSYSLAVSGPNGYSGDLGLALDGNGRLTGSLPSSGLAAGDYTVTVSASDGAGTSATKR